MKNFNFNFKHLFVLLAVLMTCINTTWGEDITITPIYNGSYLSPGNLVKVTMGTNTSVSSSTIQVNKNTDGSFTITANAPGMYLKSATFTDTQNGTNKAITNLACTNGSITNSSGTCTYTANASTTSTTISFKGNTGGSAKLGSLQVVVTNGSLNNMETLSGFTCSSGTFSFTAKINNSTVTSAVSLTTQASSSWGASDGNMSIPSSNASKTLTITSSNNIRYVAILDNNCRLTLVETSSTGGTCDGASWTAPSGAVNSVTFKNGISTSITGLKVFVITVPSCTTPTASWSTAPADGTAGGNMNASLTTNYATGVVYSSSNTDVATVSGNGTSTCAISYVAAGSTRITATVTGDGSTYCTGPATCYTDITVTAAGSGWGIAGSMNTWTAASNEMTGSGTVSTSISLSANTDYTFKVVDMSGGGTWYGNGEVWGGTKTQSVSSTGTENNCHLLTTEAGSYTFSFNTSTKDLTITYPNSYTFYYANTSSWSNVYVYKFTSNGSTGNNAGWPGVEITTPSYTCGGTNYYAATSDGYAKLIFTDNSSQTGDMVVAAADDGKYVGGTGDSWSTWPTYTVTYNANGDGAGNATGTTGSVPTDGSTYACGSTVTVLGKNTLAKAGYNFTGWNTAPGGGGTGYAEDETFTISANTTLYAQWEEIKYTVTYNVNGGGSVTPTSATQASSGASVTLPTPTWSGYTFDGWYNAGTKIGNGGASYTPTADITLYAHWTDNISGKVFSFIDNNYGDKFKSFTGYGWVAKDSTGRNKTFTNASTGVEYRVSAGCWDKKNNAISALAKFKSGTSNMSIVIPTGKIATVKISYGAYTTSNRLTVGGSNQTALSTALTDGMTNVQVSDALKEITLNNQTGTLTLGSSTGNIYIGRVSAVITGYTVSYAAGTYGSGSLASGTKTHGSNFTLSSNSSAFTRDGYVYDGWSVNADGSTKDYELGGTYSTDAAITLYPHWVALSSIPCLDLTELVEDDDYWSGDKIYDGAYYGFTDVGTVDGTGWELGAPSPGDANLLHIGAMGAIKEVKLTIAEVGGGNTGIDYYFGTTPIDNYDAGEYTATGSLSTGALSLRPASGDYNAIVFKPTGAGIKISEVCIYYEPASFTVTYAANGGTGNVPTETDKHAGETVTVLGNVGTPSPLSKTNYTFGGWSYGGNNYTAGQTFTMPAEDVTLTAIWTPETHDVDFDLTHVSFSSGTDEGSDAATYGTNFTATFAAASSYKMPSTITVTCGESTLTASTHYTWNQETGTVVVYGANITDDLVITVNSADAAPSSAVISGTYHYFPGENISLTCTPSGNNGPTTYQWYKGGKDDEDNLIDGATSATYAKNSCAFADAGSYYCKVTCNETSIWAETNSYENYDVKILRLYVNGSKGGEAYGNVDFTKVNSTTATASISLGSGWTYGFNIADGCGHYYGNSGTMTEGNTGWVTNVNNTDCGLTTTNAATYIFTINYSNLEAIVTTVTYPTANQAASKVIYFDNQTVDWSTLHYRIGKSNHTQATAMTKVSGTNNLYKVTTSEYNGFSGWHIANNAGWTGSNSIYRTYTNDDSYSITYATAHEGGAVTDAAVTVTPTTSKGMGGDKDVNDNCEFYNYSLTTGMKTDRVTISDYSNGTITVNYVDTDDEAASFTSGYADLAHSVILTSITAVPNTGYDASAVTINGNAYAANYVVTGATTIAASFTLHNYNVTYSAPSHGSYTIKVADGSATSASKTATMGQTITLVASADPEYHFTGWTISKAGGGTVTPADASATTTTFTMPADNVTITATFAINTYTVTYDGSSADSGTAPTDASSPYTSGSTVTVLGNSGSLTKTMDDNAATFLGWNTNSNTYGGTHYDEDDEFTISANTTLYAVWGYPITYNTDGGTINDDPYATYYISIYPSSGDITVLPTNVTKTGYTFAGWKTQNGSGSTVTAIDGSYTGAFSGDYALKAMWTAKETSVTINANTANHGSTAPSVFTATYGQALPAFTAATGETGYHLVGYYTDATSGTKVIDANGTFSANSGIWNRTDGATLTLYPHYEINTYTVNFASNNDDYGTVDKTSISGVPHGYTVSIDGNVLTLKETDVTATKTTDGDCYTYAFSGWSVSDGAAITGNTDITATFSQTGITYDITYNLNSGSWASSAQEDAAPTEYTCGTGATLPDNTFVTRAGYTFLGWISQWDIEHTDPLPDPVSAIADNAYGDVEYVAQWSADAYTVTYAANGGSGSVPSDANSYYLDDEVTVLGKNTLSKSGYTFVGWSYNGYVYVEGDKFNITEDATLTATWNQDATTVTLTHFETSKHNKSNDNKPDSQNYYLYGYKGSVSDANAVTLTTTSSNNYGQNSGVEIRVDNSSTLRIYANNTTNAAPATFSNVTCVAFDAKLYNSGNTERTTGYTIKVGSTTVGSGNIVGVAADGYKAISTGTFTAADGYIDIILGSGNSNNNLYVDNIAITCSASTYKKVTFNKGSGPSTVSGLPADRYVPSGSKIAEPSTNPTATGYTFGGWVTTSGGSTPFDFANTTISTDKTIYASWTANTYDVDVTLTGSKATKESGTTGTNAATYGTNHTLTFAAVSGYALPSDVTVSIGGDTKTKGTEYTWSISAGVGTLTIGGSYILGNIAITVTAEVAKTDPTVNELSGTTSVCEGDAATITLEDSDDGVTYQLYKGGVAEGDPVTGTGSALEWEVTADGTYTVKAEEDEDYNEATMDGSAVISYKTATEISTPPTTSVSGHDGVNFTLGSDLAATGEGTLTYQWYSYTSAEGAGQATVGSATTTKTLTTSKAAGTYYYKVEVIGTCGEEKSDMITVTVDNKHLLTYDANGGEGAPDAIYKSSGNMTLSSTEPTRDGYRFLGWNTEDDGTGDHYDAGGTYKMGSTAATLYAEWGETATLTWNLNVNTEESSIGTASKASTNARISNSTDMTNLANYGSLTISSSAKENLTSKIETPSTYNSGKYLYVTFDVPENYEFVPTSISVKVQPVSTNKDVKLILTDGVNTITKTQTNLSSGDITTVTETNSDETAFTGTVTLKIYCYGATNDYRLGSPITIAGNLNYVCPERATITSPTKAESIKLYTDQSKALSVSATAYAGTLNYQWQKDGVDIDGATSATYTVVGSGLTAGTTYVYTCNVSETSPASCATVTSPAFNITAASPDCGYMEFSSAVLTSKTAADRVNATLLVNGLGDMSSGSCKLNGAGAYFGLQLASGSFQVGDSIEFKIKKNNSTDIYIFATTDTTGLQTTDAIYTQSVTDGDNIIKFVVTSGSMLTALNTSKKVAVVRRTKEGVLNQNHNVYYAKVKRYGCPDIFIYDDAADNGLWSDEDNWIGPAGHGLGLPTSDDRIFINKSVTVDTEDASAAELHITNGSMVTVEKSITVGDVILETGSTLNVAKDGASAITVATNSLYLKGGWNDDYTQYDMPRVYIDPASTLTKEVSTVNFDISVDARNYYPIAVPFRVKVKDVDYANSTLAGASTYGTHYVIKEYSGELRAKNGPDRDNNWVVVPLEEDEKDVYLEPGRGYIMTAVSIPAYGGGVIRFPLDFTNAWTAEGEQGTIDDSYYKNVIALEAYEGKATDGGKKANKGWNLLGVPFMSCYTTGNDMTTGEGAAAIIQGKYNFVTGNWVEEDVCYVNVPTHDFSEYIQADITDAGTVLRPGWCFFVQIESDGDLTFLTTKQAEESDLPIYAPKREQAMPTVKTGIILSGAEASDKTTILVSDKYSVTDYEINADLEKMFGNGYTLATYSLAGETRLAYNAMSNSDATNVIPIGYRAPADGEYTFAINPRYAENGAFKHVNLIDYETGFVTDLLVSSYTFDTERTQNDTRFALNIVKAPQTTTDIGNGDGANGERANGVQKMIINDKLYIIVDGKMYDAKGAMVK